MREAWKLTRESFLDETEVADLLVKLRQRDLGSGRNESPAPLVDRLIIEGLLFSGLRNSEFCALRVADTRSIHKQSVFHVTGKPDLARSVHVPEFVSDLVDRYIREVRSVASAQVNLKNTKLPLLLNERGRPYERTGLYRRVLRVLAELGFESKASVQLLRHTYGYLAYKQTGGNILFVQQQLGHSHPMVTAVYAEFVEFPPADLAEQTAATFVPTPSRKQRKQSL